MCNKCLTRRSVFSAGMGALAVTASVAAARAQPVRSADTPDAALARLVEGNARYVAGKLNERDFSAGRASRAAGQAPFAAILGCADSRVAPELAFDQAPGDLFVVRVAGNFVTPDGLASLEYGATVLGTKAIMVLGHIGDLVSAMKPGIEPALKQSGGDLEQRAVIANVRYNVQRLQEAKPILADMVAKG